MHRTAWRPAARRESSRHTRMAACVAAVLVAHGALFGLLAREVGPTARVAAVQVRTVAIAAPILLQAQTHARSETSTAPRPAVRPPPAPAPSVPRVDRASTASPSAADVDAAPVGVDAIAALDAPPVAPLPTRVPSPAQLRYVLRQGEALGEAQLDWAIDGERYELQLHALLPRGRAIEQRSQGGFDDSGVAPLRLADRHAGRDVRAANFQRDRGTVSFSGPGWELPLQPGTQDRLSWLVQLAAIAGAAPDALREGAQWTMWVVGVRGALSPWRFEVRGREVVGNASAWWLVREPSQPYDLRIEVWLDPMRGPWPLRLRQTQVPGGEPLEWTLRNEAPAAGT
jgi:hypothetical protein